MTPPTPAAASTENIDRDTGLPSDVMKEIEATDPEYAHMRKATSEKKAQKQQLKGEEADHPSEEPNGPEEGDAPAGEPTEEDPKPDGDEAGEEKPDADAPESDGDDAAKPEGDGEENASAFADNVIEGLKGEDFAKLPENVQEALGSFVQKHGEESEQSKELKAKLDKLLSDPVAADRAKLIDEGKADRQYIAPGLTVEEKAFLQSEVGLDDDEFKKLEAGIDKIAQDKAEAIVKNRLISSDQERQIAETTKKGQQLLLGLSKFNKNLALKETDMNRLYELKERHPEWEKYVNGIGKIQQWAASMGIDYGKAIQMGETPFYAAAAAALKMPVAINTQERDQKMIAETRKRALAPFLKGGSSKGLSTDASSADRSKLEKTISDGGYDIVRLANDADYYSAAVEKKFGNQAHKDYIDGLVSKGRAILSKHKQKK